MNFVQTILKRAGLSRPTCRWRLTGPFRGITGYDRMVRTCALLLEKRGVELELHEIRHWTPTRIMEPLPRCFTRRIKRGKVELHLHFGLPTQVVPSSDCPNINYSMFEADRIPLTWVAAAERVDLILVPTESSRESWIRSGVPENKIHLCPQGADFRAFSPHVQPLELQTDNGQKVSGFRYRFLNVAEFIPRKNLLSLLRVWLRATERKDNAVLILKTGFYAQGSRDVFDAAMTRIEEEEHRSFTQAAPIVRCENQLTETDMPRFYTAATHYWSMSCGEGFDLPMMEAAASDRQLIAPFHSAYRHYLTPANAFLIPAHEEEAVAPNQPDGNVLFQGTRWWKPDELQAAEILRQIIAGEAAPRCSARASLEPTCTWTYAVDHLIQELQKFLMERGRTRSASSLA